MKKETEVHKYIQPTENKLNTERKQMDSLYHTHV